MRVVDIIRCLTASITGAMALGCDGFRIPYQYCDGACATDGTMSSDRGNPTDQGMDSRSDGAGCQAPLIRCGNACVNTFNDRDNCGACGRACLANQVCNEGRCAENCNGRPLPPDTSCTAGDSRCGGGVGQLRCAPAGSNTGPFVCYVPTLRSNGPCNGLVGGQCVTGGQCACPDGGVTCPSMNPTQCVNTQNDPLNCGSCSNSCAGGRCLGGSCCGLPGGGPCCDDPDGGTECNNGSTCVNGTRCEECGTANYICCSNHLGCARTETCVVNASDASCMPCGMAAGQPCCVAEGDPCRAGLFCVSSVGVDRCRPCGSLGAPCCDPPVSPCAPNLTCRSGNICGCGRSGESCCATGPQCESGVCNSRGRCP